MIQLNVVRAFVGEEENRVYGKQVQVAAFDVQAVWTSPRKVTKDHVPIGKFFGMAVAVGDEGATDEPVAPVEPEAEGFADCPGDEPVVCADEELPLEMLAHAPARSKNVECTYLLPE